MTGRPATYTTKQGEAVLAYLRSRNGEHLTAAQIAAHFAAGEGAMGRATVYRQLHKLAEQGLVRKYKLDQNEGACYQFMDEARGAPEHYHLKCQECGRLIHLESGMLPWVQKGIFDRYAFEVDVGKTVFYGRCGACLQKAGTESLDGGPSRCAVRR